MVPDVCAFRSITATDLPIIRRWLAMPHVAQWWGDPHEQFALISEDLDHPAMDQFVVTLGDRPFAYLQCYDPTAWPDNGLGEHPEGTRGIDQFIGEEGMIERGHGSAMIRMFVDSLLQTGTPRTLTDPDPRNARAIRAYEKAGFQRDRLVDTPDGRALLMVRDA
jgi:aminoglycoside 6'-N-acetyltransferase